MVLNLYQLLKMANETYHNRQYQDGSCANYFYKTLDVGRYRCNIYLHKDEIYIAIRGSNCVENWVKNILDVAVEEGYKLLLTELHQEIDFKDYKKIVLVGHSMGGSIAMRLTQSLQSVYVKNNNIYCFAFEPYAPFEFKVDLKNTFYIDRSGNSRLRGALTTSKVNVSGDTINISTQKTPASATATGTKGDIVHDSNYIYVCVATNTWKRTAITTW